MSDKYGIIAWDRFNRVTLHSEYSNLIYLGKVVSPVSSSRVWLTGSGLKGYDTNKFNVGITSRYVYTSSLNYLIPFFRPAAANSSIAPISMKKSGDAWEFTIVHDEGFAPQIYFFGLFSELNPTVTDEYGVNVYKEDGSLSYSSQFKPLKLDRITTSESPALDSSTLEPEKFNLKSRPSSYKYFRTYPDTLVSWSSVAYAGMYYKATREWSEKRTRVFEQTRQCGDANVAWTELRASISVGASGVQLSYIGASGGWAYNRDCGSWGYGWVAVFVVGLLTGGLILAAAAATAAYVYNDLRGDAKVPVYEAPLALTTNHAMTIMTTRASYYE
jgi:hypothetical protein